MKRLLLALIPLAVPAEASAESVRFIACPVYRDTDAGRKSGCWLADDPASGTRYDVSQAPSKPDWNFEILVEGSTAAGKEDPCGGVILDPVRTSILPGACARHMLPAESYKGRTFVLPRRNITPLSVTRKPPPPPYAARTFSVFYDFNRDFLIYQYGDYLLEQAVDWLRAARPNRIVVTGYAATEPTQVSGRTIAENPGIARRRAEKIGESLRRLGFDDRQVTVEWKERPAPTEDPEADGLAEASKRRVDIAVTF